MPKQLKIFDSHCHLDFKQFEGKLELMLDKAREAGICGILIPGVEHEGWRRIRQMTARYPLCHTALGLHPMYVSAHQKSHLHDLELALSVGPIAAIGEIGLDYYKAENDRKLQKEYFEAQLVIAREARLPVVLHVRKAHDEVLLLLKNNHFNFGGIVHAFNGSEYQAERYISMGFKLGFGGAMTFPRAAKIRKLATSLPLESIVLETDAPDMPPVSCKQSYNTPLHLFDNFKSLDSLREESSQEIAEQTTKNAYSILNFD